MIDQYGNAVPADLVVIPSFNLLNNDEREVVFASDWYEVDEILLADVGDELGGDRPCDVGLHVDPDGNLCDCTVYKVDDTLKRGNDEDGFYHA